MVPGAMVASGQLTSYRDTMRYAVLLLLFLVATGHAAVYKSVNEDGEVVYSDTPAPDAERVRLPKLQTYNPDDIPSLARIKRIPVKNDFYSGFVFVQPEDNATIRDNLGMVTTELSLQPALITGRGHRIQFYLDNQPYGPPIEQLTVNMSNLVRGEHRLSASVIDENGDILISTGERIVHVKRESLLMPKGSRDAVDGAPVNPNMLTDNPNKRTDNPNIRTTNPNIFTTHPNVLSPEPAESGQ